MRVHKTCIEKSQGKRILKQPRCRWEYGIKVCSYKYEVKMQTIVNQNMRGLLQLADTVTSVTIYRMIY